MLICFLTSSTQDKLHQNPFVETTLSYVLTYITTTSPQAIAPASITILADDSYYTQSAVEVSKAKAKQKTFSDFGLRLSEAHKTGLGSSAALVTALTAALLVHYLPKGSFSPGDDDGKRRLHNLAQIAHCAAQGKVGSGFDVASAVYGSCLYRRFSPSLLENHGSLGTPGFADQIKDLVEENTASTKWDTEIHKDAVKVPKGIRLVMCDVDCGSQTPGMVKQVLAWRKREPEEAEMLWSALHRKNESLAVELKRLAISGDGDYSTLKQRIADIRMFIRDMSRLSDVPIEPTSQTKLIDACSGVEGVIGGVVPGAGGFDAIALLIEDREEVMVALDELLKGWKVEAYQEGESGPSIGRVSRLPVREEMEGIRLEELPTFENWVA